MAVLEYNGHTQQVCLDEVSIVRESIRHPSSGVVLGHKETWTVAATLIGDTASLATQITALENAYKSDGHDLVLKTAVGGTTLHQLVNSAAANGVRITQRPSFPTLKNAEFVTKRAYTLVAEAELYDGDPALLLDDQRWNYQVGQDGKTTRTLSGRLETAAGQSAIGYFASKDPGTPGGYTRGPKTSERNHDDTELTYSYVDREHWQAMPSGVLDGSYTSTLTKEGNVRTLTIAGRWVGPLNARNAAINALRQTGRKLLSESIVTEPFSGASSFTLVYEYMAPEIISFRETVRTVDWWYRQIYREVLGGESPVRQEGGRTTARATVSGQAVGRTKYPAFPEHLWDVSHLVPGGEELILEGPTVTADGKYSGYGISWRYEYEFADSPAVRLPRIR